MHGSHGPLADLEKNAPALSPAATGRRVLIVEDNCDTAESLRLLLQFFGHEVSVAGTGLDGVELARRCRPEVVLCDIGLPGLDGFGVATELRRDPATAGAFLVAITGYGSDQTRCRCREVGFDRYYTKPVDPELLVELLAGAPVCPV